MAADVKKKIVEVDVKTQKIGELKEQVKELTRLMDSLDKESLEYNRTVDMLVDAEEELNTVMKVGKSQLSAKGESYNALVNKMSALKKVMHSVQDSATRNRLSDEIAKINGQLKEMDARNGVYVRNVGDYENAVKKALKTPQQELKALRVQLAQLTEGTTEYNAVFTRMAQLTHDVTEQQEMLRWSSADLGDILGNIAGVATSIAGGFSAVNALGGLLGMSEDEDLEKAMLQAQRFLQLIQGLEQLEELADKIKGLWQGIKNFANSATIGTAALTDFQKETEKAEAATTGAASAINTNAAATNTGAEATNKATEALAAYNTEEEKWIAKRETANAKRLEKIDAIQREVDILQELLDSEGDGVTISDESRKSTELQIAARQDSIKQIERMISSDKKLIQQVKDGTNKFKVNNTAIRINTEETKANTAATNAQSAANVKAAATTGLFSKALGVLKTAMASTGIGIIIAALGALLNLLGKGVKALWGWISGANKAKEQTERAPCCRTGA